MLNLMLLGDESALTLGTDLHIYRQIYLLVSSLIVGFVVYSAGMIGFVGLVVPHVIRMLVGTDHKKLIPVAALTGAIFLVVADGLCRIIIPRTELPIGILIFNCNICMKYIYYSCILTSDKRNKDSLVRCFYENKFFPSMLKYYERKEEL